MKAFSTCATAGAVSTKNLRDRQRYVNTAAYPTKNEVLKIVIRQKKEADP
jgi:hypothetical protein